MTEGDLPPQPQSVPVGRRVNLRLRAAVAVAFLLVGVALISWPQFSQRRNVSEHAQRIEQASGLRIGYGAPADFWVPPFEPKDSSAPWISMRPAEVVNVAISLEGIDAALEQYPPGFVSRLIKAVFICDELRMYGEKAAGTAGPAWIVISARTDYGPDGIRSVGYTGLHHELSSFVLRVDPSTRFRWSEFAPADWKFVERADGALRRGHTADPSPETGFVSAYGATNLENDFNVYAEMMFTEPAKIAQLARQYPLVRRKLDFVMAAYVAIDSRLADRFRGMGLEDGAE